MGERSAGRVLAMGDPQKLVNGEIRYGGRIVVYFILFNFFLFGFWEIPSLKVRLDEIYNQLLL